MSNFLYLYTNFLEGEAKAASSLELERALKLFWRKTGLSPEAVLKTEKGKPYFSSGELYLSVTHSGAFYAVAFASFPIGIDAEKKSEVRERIAEKKFTPEERLLPFSHVWCGKEAVAKLLGGGLQLVNKISIKDGYAEYEGKRYTLREKIVNRTYRVMIATEEGRNWDGAETLSEK